ncbi:MAG: HIT domain-containing protein [Syntrophobacterales bacterium]|nr:HIT domain-containing protein [Syntrophobacterales bacterium]
MALEFWRQRDVATFVNPLKNWQLDEQILEFRRDPLLGHVSLFSPAIQGKRDILYPAPDYSYVRSIADATRASCFLCDGKWERMTPRYSEDLIQGGRLKKGEVLLFPNLFPTSPYHAVIMLGEDHYRSLDNFPEDLLLDAFDVAVEFIKRVFQKDSRMSFVTINANYLPPAGSSVFHPHIQVLMAQVPSTHYSRVMEASKKYYERNGTPYWKDFVDIERQGGERYIMSIGESHWIMAFSPMGTNEVVGVFPDKVDILKWEVADVRALSKGVSRVLRFFHSIGFSTFNFSLFGGPLGEGDIEPYGAFIRLVCRQNFLPHYRTDDYYFQKLMENEIMATPPEELARIFREMLEE